MIYIFVYGTLKKGYSNHYRLTDANFLGEATTKPIFTMIDLGSFPGLLLDGHTAIKGEVYAITEDILKDIDYLEGYPYLYDRIKITLQNGQEAYTYIYNNHQNNYEVIENGCWPSN